MKELQHFILTRFNLVLWHRDKEGQQVRTTNWLEHGFMLFEQYCLPSIVGQTCQEFTWIVLFDSTIPAEYRERIVSHKKNCPQFVPVFVEPENGRFFAEIFRREIVKRLDSKRVVTTYLDNDDALNIRFVEDLQQRALAAENGTFFYYDNGYQYYMEDQFLLQINYPRNHFVSVMEEGCPSTLKGIYGDGGHSRIDKKEWLKIEHVKTEPMWCEVVHEKNMINDANFIVGTRMVRNNDLLRREFALDETVRTGIGIYVFGFLPRYLRTFIKRAKNRIFDRVW